jgi:mono/diheme cytochrome c family protein
MSKTPLVLIVLVFASFGVLSAKRDSAPGKQDTAQAKSDSAEPKMTPEDAAKKNPVAPTAEGLAEARKLYGYDCAMCHGKDGDGKGDLAADMKLDLHDWRDPSALEKMTDGELFWVISNGRGKMIGGEGNRSPEKMRWNLVNLVRSFAKKGAAEKAKSETPQS